MEPIIGGGGNGTAADAVKDGDTDSFIQDVLEASKSVPVIVDFWADWCNPCKQLTPVLEKVVRHAGGKVRLVKINADENQALVSQLRVQSLPTVLAFKNGQPVDGFQGAMPESQLQDFVRKLAGDAGPNPADEFMDAARQAESEKDHARAVQAYSQALQADPGRIEAAAGLIRALVHSGQVDEAKQFLDQIPAEAHNHDAIRAAMSAIELAEGGGADVDTAKLEKRISKNPDDHAARFDLAKARAARGDMDGAGEHLLEIIRRDPGWNDNAARDQLLKYFEAAGPADPFTLRTRRKLSSILFS